MKLHPPDRRGESSRDWQLIVDVGLHPEDGSKVLHLRGVKTVVLGLLQGIR